MKQVEIENLKFSQIMCGTNAFYARSHFSNARDIEYRKRFNNEEIEQIVLHCLEMGINTIESSANKRIYNIISKLRDTTQKTIHLIGSTRIDDTSDMTHHSQKLSYLIENNLELCIVHAQYVDRPRKSDTISGLDKLIDEIHQAGLLAGISTHRVDTIELCEQKSMGIDVYMFPLNISGFVYEGYQGTETPQHRAELVQSIPKPFILMKTLGAGRIPPNEGLQFVAENMKPNDLVSLGFGTKEEINEDIEILEKYL
ncbi:hypothetical protein ACFLT7_07375 [candidate division KSB1 bacterium]